MTADEGASWPRRGSMAAAWAAVAIVAREWRNSAALDRVVAAFDAEVWAPLPPESERALRPFLLRRWAPKVCFAALGALPPDSFSAVAEHALRLCDGDPSWGGECGRVEEDVEDVRCILNNLCAQAHIHDRRPRNDFPRYAGPLFHEALRLDRATDALYHLRCVSSVPWAAEDATDTTDAIVRAAAVVADVDHEDDMAEWLSEDLIDFARLWRDR